MGDNLLDDAFDFARDQPGARFAAEVEAQQERLLREAGLAELDPAARIQRLAELVRVRHVACATVLAGRHGVEVDEALAAFDRAKALIADALEHVDWEHGDQTSYEWDGPQHPDLAGFSEATYERALEHARTLPR